MEKEASYEQIAFLALSNINGLGFNSLKKIAQSGVSFLELLKKESDFISFEKKLHKMGIKKIHFNCKDTWGDFCHNLWKEAQEIYRILKQKNIHILFQNDSNFPQKLKNIEDPPYWLFVHGNVSILNEFSIALVGTRQPTKNGEFLANYMGYSLDKFKSVIVSGLAHGIDQLMHQYCVQMKVPTIAFLGTGILSDYPAGSQGLKESIIKSGGAIVTEYLLKESYNKHNFVLRNRLQAGISEIVIPIEWKKSSGTGHTVNYAHRFNKKIICLKVPVWNGSREELIYAKEIGAETFIIPGEEQRLYNKIAEIKEACTPKDKKNEYITDDLFNIAECNTGGL